MLTEKELTALFSQHQTRAKGLTDKEVQKKLAETGPNIIAGKRKKPLILSFLEEFKDLMVVILIVASVLAYIAGEATDASVIMFIVVLNAVIGFVQKFKAEKAIEALKKLIAPQARVMRNGTEIMVDAKNLVPGDILVLGEGDRVTADALLIESNELEAQEAALTGESMPVQKLLYDIAETKGTEAEKENIVFMGTSITHGSGRAIVLHTGMKTQMGNIARLTTETKKETSPLQKELTRIGIFVGQISLVISAILLAIGVFVQGKQFADTLLFAVSVAVAAVPEGLPATITIALAIGVQKLAKKNAIMKQLSSVETLGSTTVICSDKTGTLTKNEMTVRELYFNSHDASVHGAGYSPAGYLNIRKDGKTLVTIGQQGRMYEDYEIARKELENIRSSEPAIYDSLWLIMAAAVICNNADLEKSEGAWKVLGDPTEGSLITLAEKTGFRREHIREQFKKIHEISFDSGRKRMTIIVEDAKGQIYAFTKGAPDGIIDISTHYLIEGKESLFQSEAKKKFIGINEDMARRALRGLALAYKKLDEKEIREYRKDNIFPKQDIEQGLTFLGLVGMIDPPRPEVKEAVRMAKKANIRVYIITGDHGLTAEAIAKDLGIVGNKREHRIITGEDLQKIENNELQKLLANRKLDIIFARVSPEHKLRIVTLLKELNEIVAVTGDGVNDAPALKKADIGIAMGITGTDVSKEASNMVLADDSFSTIVTAIKEGRTIYDNLKKFVFYIFSCNIGELITVFAAIILGLPAPLTAILILCVDLGTDVLPAVALGIDPSEPGIMEKKPRDPKKKIMDLNFVARYAYLGIIIGAIVMGVYIWTLYRYGWTWGEHLADDNMTYLKASTMAFTTLVIIQMVNAFNSRSEQYSVFRLGLFSNLWLIGAIIISLILTFLMVEVPAIQHYIGTTHLNGADWEIVIGASLLVLLIEEFRKWITPKKLAPAKKHG